MWLGDLSPTFLGAVQPRGWCGLYNLGIQISGVATLMTGVNFFTTILKMRAPGNGHDADARLHLDGAGHDDSRACGLPRADRCDCRAHARPAISVCISSPMMGVAARSSMSV